MSEMIVTTEEILVAPAVTPEFSWRAVFAGALVGSGVIFFLLALGAGVGLSLFSIPNTSPGAPSYGVTLGAIYFFASQAFGLAVGGHLAGRLMGAVRESESEEIFHSSAHGLVVWALAVAVTATMVVISGLALTASGLTAAATIGAENSSNQTAVLDAGTAGYWVDTLFRPTSTVSGPPPVEPIVGRSEAEARAEAGRILTVGLLGAERLSMADHDQIAWLISRFTGADMTEAARRVDDVQSRIHQEQVAIAEAARKFARYVMLWLAASLVFGALVSSGAAVSGRWVDDKARAAA